ncbi:hypothetical protein K458DRAFT_381739 [Lentithecium fluviatile CBS 122367]|uniref:Uncharacterized protein n=1 Tax=Lentithecium fluviatile CBS 122367 TaxID=1168545 RepID=A0A6G1JMX5_9PLEO|nr:hypothetical protein K458DRAFT_381739 [Lentithecium fluviatile CBS 122367]
MDMDKVQGVVQGHRIPSVLGYFKEWYRVWFKTTGSLWGCLTARIWNKVWFKATGSLQCLDEIMVSGLVGCWQYMVVGLVQVVVYMVGLSLVVWFGGLVLIKGPEPPIAYTPPAPLCGTPAPPVAVSVDVIFELKPQTQPFRIRMLSSAYDKH